MKKFIKWLFFGKDIYSQIVFLVLFYFILKFITYPFFLQSLGLKDIVAVMSGSMSHKVDISDSFYKFMALKNISISNLPFKDGLEIGDVVLVEPVNNCEIDVGDVIVFHPKNYPLTLIHRVIEKRKVGDFCFYTTKGDANNEILSVEMNISGDEIVGKAIAKIPFIGLPRVLLKNIFGI